MTTNNHPAHGPLSLDRLHQIREILSKASAQSDGGNLGYAMADAVKVIDVAIAAFGAEPVAYMCKDGDDIEYNGHNEFSGGGKGVPLYTTPPAPVVPEGLRMALSNAGIAAPESDEMLAATHEKYIQALVTWVKDRKPFQPAQLVPEEVSWEDVPEEITEDNMEVALAWAHGFNHYRAAMLQAGNSPVTPEGWIPVSERIPEAEGRYWCYVEEQNCLGKSHYQWNCSWNGERWWVENDNGGRVTHWMELPAAPQQEVKCE
ncbi:TPA: DUF551 domain-containing protein [Citrobacter braakii]